MTETLPIEGAQSNARLAERSIQSVWHPCTQMQRMQQNPPLAIAKGAGVWLYDYDGNRYFDAISSWWVNILGHANPRINAAIIDQLNTLPHIMLAGCTHAPAIALAERLSARTGGALGHAFYASDGASAIEIALKMSFHYRRNHGEPARNEFVCLRSSYHGETLGALSVTDVPIFRDAYDPLLRQAHIVASPHAPAGPASEQATQAADDALAALQALLAQRSDKISAVIVEPLVQCAAGMAMYSPRYLQGLRRLCDTYGVHLIADEIAVGCGRTGTFFAFEQAIDAPKPVGESAPCSTSAEAVHAQWPDFICLSKGITGGTMALSIVLSRDAIYRAFLDERIDRGFLHSHSYTGNPLACRAALAVLECFETDGVLEKNKALAQILSQHLAPIAADPRIENFRQQGMIWAFDIRREYLPANFPDRFHLAARAHELLMRPIGKTVYLMPPYVFDEQEAIWLVQQLTLTLNATLSEHPQPDAPTRSPEPHTV